MTPAEQVQREQVRLAAADRFAQGASQAEVAREFRVSPRTGARPADG
ncbi:helix-turn-helix domain-containing protein [Candidatus Protofrankia californiensis]|nr:helix-turn-helix domain-containing protein [Candidatus Protofrankia californiensis]